jgi:hypothetical protein
MGGRNPTQFSTKTYLDVLRLNCFGKVLDFLEFICYNVGTTKRKEMKTNEKESYDVK